MNVRDDLAEDDCGVLYPGGDAMSGSENKSEAKSPWRVQYKCESFSRARKGRVKIELPLPH